MRTQGGKGKLGKSERLKERLREGVRDRGMWCEPERERERERETERERQRGGVEAR